MSNYFSNFNKQLYYFGNEISPVAIQDLSKYVNLIDEIADQISAYVEYEIGDFERPDTLSHKLYGSSVYDWTFYLMNDNIREQGWPLPLQSLYTFATKELYPDWTCKLDISTADSAASFASKFAVGDSCDLNGRVMIVKSKNLQVGEITVRSPRANQAEDSNYAGLTVLSDIGGTNQTALTATVQEALGTYEYRNDSDLPYDYFFENPVTSVPITNLDKLIEENDALKKIRVIQKNQIESVSGKFRSLTGS